MPKHSDRRTAWTSTGQRVVEHPAARLAVANELKPSRRVVLGEELFGFAVSNDPKSPPVPSGLKPEEQRAWEAFTRRSAPAGSLRVFLPGTYSQPFVAELGGQRVVLKALGAGPAPGTAGRGLVAYENAYEGVDSLSLVRDSESEEFLRTSRVQGSLGCVTESAQIQLSRSASSTTRSGTRAERAEHLNRRPQGREKMRTPIRIGLAVVALVMAVPTEAAKKPLKVKLRFSPQENVTAAAPNMDQTSITRPIQILPLTDERALDDKTLIGENREGKTPVPVYALSSVAEFATEALKTCLLGWGVKIAPDADLVLKGAIVTLFVTEGNTYVSNARLRFRLESRAGEALWEGVAAGDATRWGRSLSADNYNEELSDALKKAYASLLSNNGLQDAWVGRTKGPRASQTSISPREMKEKILSLMKEGVGKEVVAAYVREHAISPKLTAAEIVEWKKAGIPEPVISAALNQK